MTFGIGGRLEAAQLLLRRQANDIAFWEERIKSYMKRDVSSGKGTLQAREGLIHLKALLP